MSSGGLSQLLDPIKQTTQSSMPNDIKETQPPKYEDFNTPDPDKPWLHTNKS